MRLWYRKFACALRGLRLGVRGEASYLVHLPAAVAVLLAAAWLDAALWQWCVLILSISLVISLEMLNTSIERFAKAIHPDQAPRIGDALDIASAAVLVGSLGASGIGLLVLGNLLLEYLAR